MATEPSMAGVPLSSSAPPPDGRPLLTVRSYEDAERVVDALADARFPIRYVEIVGRGVRTVEDVTGRYGLGQAVAGAILTGALVGLFFGLLFDWWGFVSPESDWGWVALWGLVYGALAGWIVGVLVGWAGNRRHFTSVRTLQADAYDITLTGGERAEALRVLHAAGLV